jgi:nucleoside-diphosphate-sugar epimerase
MEIQMADILITGGAGNFGRMLGRALLDKGHRIRLLDLPMCDFDFCESWENTSVYKGDILDPASMVDAVHGADWVFHLAAILPPASEADRNRTFNINVDGTRNLLEICTETNRKPKVAFASSISVYGDTSNQTEPIGPEHIPNPNDIYAGSKVEAEKLLMASGLPWVNLRISAIAIPEFLDPPEPWPFMPNQRIELVVLDDLVTAMVNLVSMDEAGLNQTHIIAGGPTWQVTGQQYVQQWGNIMEIPYDEMTFLNRPGWLNWYNTIESQKLLNYQQTSLEEFFSQLKTAVDEALA